MDEDASNPLETNESRGVTDQEPEIGAGVSLQGFDPETFLKTEINYHFLPHTRVWVENYEEDDADGGDDDELGFGSGEDTKWEEEL